MWLALVGVALASPVVTVSGVGAVGDGPEGVRPWAGGSAAMGAAVAPRLLVEGSAVGGATTGGSPVLGLGPTVRFTAGDLTGTTLSLLASGGAQWEEQLWARLAAGAAVTLSSSDGAVRPVVEGRYVWTPGGAPVRLEVSLGVRWQRPEAAPESEPEPVVLEPAPFQVTSTDAMVWVPRPVCAWLEPEPANAAFADNEMRLAEVFELDAGTGIGGERGADATTSMIVVGWPGDKVWVDGAPTPLDDDGAAVVEHAEGEVEVTITGGGRTLTQELGLALGHALWVSAPQPEPVRVAFTVGSAVLAAEAVEQLTALVDSAGETSFEIIGSASPEGDVVANEALARARAQALASWLEAQGLDPSRLSIGPAVAPDPELPLPDQRYAEIRPQVGGEP